MLAADQFLITPAGRVEDPLARAPSGRTSSHGDCRISLVHRLGPRHNDQPRRTDADNGPAREAGYILAHVRPLYTRRPDSEYVSGRPEEGLYHTADATLWFFHAMDRYLEATDDRDTCCAFLPKLLDIVHHHVEGTRFGMHVDPRTGLLRQGEQGYQLTWMDAKVDDWVVTPRRGKAVEINALWYNACGCCEWLEGRRNLAEAELHHWPSTPSARNRSTDRFWYEKAGISTMWSTAKMPESDDPRAVRTSCWRFRSNIRCLTQSRWEPVVTGVQRTAADARGLAIASPGTRITRRSTTAICGRAMRLIIRARFGLADRPLYRRLAEDAS